MENLVTRVCAALHQQGWTVLKQDAAPCRLPQCVSSRYHNPPAEWVEFLRCVRSCVSAEETTWFLCLVDFERTGYFLHSLHLSRTTHTGY